MNYKFEGQNKGASAESIKSLRKKIGELPADYVEFLSQTDGGRAQLNFKNAKCDIDIWVLFTAVEVPQQADVYSDRLSTKHLLPVASTSAGDLVCLGRPSNKVFLWDHEQGLPDEGLFLAKNFETFWRSLKVRVWEERYPSANWSALPKDWVNETGLLICECAAIEGHLMVVQKCLEGGYPIGDALRYAAMNGGMEIVDALVAHGQDINHPDKEGRTPLDWASWDPDNVPPLRERGALTGAEMKGKKS